MNNDQYIALLMMDVQAAIGKSSGASNLSRRLEQAIIRIKTLRIFSFTGKEPNKFVRNCNKNKINKKRP